MPALTRRLFASTLAATALLGARPAAARTGPDRPDPVDAAVRALILAGPEDRARALDTLAPVTDLSLAPSLIFALRFTRGPRAPIVAKLAEITGETDRRDWFDWMLWQERNPQVRPRPAFVRLKRDVYLAIDPNFEVFLAPEHLEPGRMEIRLEEITWGGVRKDGIPSLDNPAMVSATEAEYLLDDDLVFGIEVEGDVRAYPLRIMGWHEMFNDVVGGVPLALAYCTLCGAGILFETEVGRRAPLVFGSSGFLYRSNKLMFDRETHSLWNQFTGEPVVGPLVGSGLRLAQRPVTIARWDDWRARNPFTKVLSLDTGHVRDYGSGVVYREYFASADLMFPTSVDERRLKQKDHVFGIRTFGGAKAWPIEAFRGGRVINDRVGDSPVVLIGEAEGRTVRAYDRGGLRFAPGRSAREVVSGDGRVWRVTEAALVAPDGVRAPRVAGHLAYWFAWDGYLGARSALFEG